METQSAPVLVTRPAREAEAFAADLKARFGDRVRPVVAPLIAPRFLTPLIPHGNYAAVVFTSAQAVEAVRALDLPLPRLAWCVGRKTAAAATAAGFQSRSADGNAQTLAEAIISNPPDGRLLYLHGVDTHANLAETLESSGVATDVAIVYLQEAQPLSDAAIDLLLAPVDVIVPLFSTRTASLFQAALPTGMKARLHFAAMSAAVADPLRDLPQAALVIAARPDAPAMLDAVESLLAAWPVP